MHCTEFNASGVNAFFTWTLGRLEPGHRGERKWECAVFPMPKLEEKPQKQLYRRPKRRKSCRCRFSSTRRGGKPAGAALPPLKTAEKLQVQLFLHSERRKACRCSFTAAPNGGKDAGAAFPPLRVVGNLQVRVCLSLSGDKAVVWSHFVPALSSVSFVAYGDAAHKALWILPVHTTRTSS